MHCDLYLYDNPNFLPKVSSNGLAKISFDVTEPNCLRHRFHNLNRSV